MQMWDRDDDDDNDDGYQDPRRLQLARVLVATAILEHLRTYRPPPTYPPRNGAPFAIDESNLSAVDQYRFQRDELHWMAQRMLPPVMRSANGTRWSALEGLCLVLKKLAWPVRLKDLCAHFRRAVGPLSRICIALSSECKDVTLQIDGSLYR